MGTDHGSSSCEVPQGLAQLHATWAANGRGSVEGPEAVRTGEGLGWGSQAGAPSRALVMLPGARDRRCSLQRLPVFSSGGSEGSQAWRFLWTWVTCQPPRGRCNTEADTGLFRCFRAHQSSKRLNISVGFPAPPRTSSPRLGGPSLRRRQHAAGPGPPQGPCACPRRRLRGRGRARWAEARREAGGGAGRGRCGGSRLAAPRHWPKVGQAARSRDGLARLTAPSLRSPLLLPPPPGTAAWGGRTWGRREVRAGLWGRSPARARLWDSLLRKKQGKKNQKAQKTKPASAAALPLKSACAPNTAGVPEALVSGPGVEVEGCPPCGGVGSLSGLFKLSLLEDN